MLTIRPRYSSSRMLSSFPMSSILESLSPTTISLKVSKLIGIKVHGNHANKPSTNRVCQYCLGHMDNANNLNLQVTTTSGEYPSRFIHARDTNRTLIVGTSNIFIPRPPICSCGQCRIEAFLVHTEYVQAVIRFILGHKANLNLDDARVRDLSLRRKPG
jgi:hypothetical protein